MKEATVPDIPKEQPAAREISINIPEDLAIALESVAKDKTLPEWFLSVANTAIRKAKKKSDKAPSPPASPELEKNKYQEWLEDFNSRTIRVLTYDESDRGCVLLSQSFIEEGMEHLLRAYFKKCNPSNSESRIDNLLSEGANAALQSHSVRLMLAYTLGVIDIGMFVALNRLRDIRNAFAHRTDNEPPMITYEIARELLNSLYSSQSPPRPHVSLAIPNPNPSQTHPMFSSRHFSGNRRAKGTHPRAEIGK